MGGLVPCPGTGSTGPGKEALGQRPAGDRPPEGPKPPGPARLRRTQTGALVAGVGGPGCSRYPTPCPASQRASSARHRRCFCTNAGTLAPPVSGARFPLTGPPTSRGQPGRYRHHPLPNAPRDRAEEICEKLSETTRIYQKLRETTGGGARVRAARYLGTHRGRGRRSSLFSANHPAVAPSLFFR